MHSFCLPWYNCAQVVEMNYLRSPGMSPDFLYWIRDVRDMFHYFQWSLLLSMELVCISHLVSAVEYLKSSSYGSFCRCWVTCRLCVTSQYAVSHLSRRSPTDSRAAVSPMHSFCLPWYNCAQVVEMNYLRSPGMSPDFLYWIRDVRDMFHYFQWSLLLSMELVCISHLVSAVEYLKSSSYGSFCRCWVTCRLCVTSQYAVSHLSRRSLTNSEYFLDGLQNLAFIFLKVFFLSKWPPAGPLWISVMASLKNP